MEEHIILNFIRRMGLFLLRFLYRSKRLRLPVYPESHGNFVNLKIGVLRTSEVSRPCSPFPKVTIVAMSVLQISVKVDVLHK